MAMRHVNLITKSKSPMFRHQIFQRSVSSVVLVAFTSLTFYPMAVSAQARAAADMANNIRQAKSDVTLGAISSKFPVLATTVNTTAVTKTSSAEDRLSQLLKQIQDEVKAVAPTTSIASNTTTSTPAKTSLLALTATTSNKTDLINQHVSTIRSANSQIKALYSDIDQSFKDTEQHLKDAKLSSEILARHSKAVALYQSRQAEFDKIMERVADADDKRQTSDRQTALTDLSSFMDKYPNAKPHQYTDPNKLPFGSSSNKVRKPNETKAQYQASLFPPKYDKVMLAGQIPDGLKLAQATLPDIPVAQDTAATEDIQLTPAIKAQAAALNNNPVQIYNWVRNNISFIPSYGSIQGSELTLQNKRGNAFDTASLLIALYRSAGIPARYVYGTIDVPADKVMNWVGGVTRAEAAQSLLGQGGIPNIGLSSGGKISTIRMEHVWVEAFVDYAPSRGAINKKPNTWVPMDASFKQYTFTQGMDLKNKVQLNSQDLLAQVQQGATVNEAGGYVQNLNQANLQMQISNYQTQVQNYVTNQKMNAALGDIFGEKKIITENYAILLGSLPYQTIAIGNTFQRLPDNLHVRISFNLYTSAVDKANRQPALTKTLNLSDIAGKRIAVAYTPATEADRQIISQYVNDQSSALPSYLIQQKAQLRLDETVLAEYPAQEMGMPQYWSYTLFTPDGNQIEEDFKAESAVGDEIVFGVNGNGISPAQVESRYTNVDPNTSLENLNQIALGYWARADISDEWMAKQSQYVTYRQPSIGMFAQPLAVRYYFGIPRFASYKSYLIDIRRLIQSAEGGDGNIKLPDYIFRSGMKNSYLEGAVLEEVLDLGKGQGMSAVEVLKEANEIGIPIWMLNNSNLASFLNVTNLSLATQQAIIDSVASGLIVYAPEREVNLSYWSGSAYIAIDKTTGAGAYILESGTNGGAYEACEEEKQPITVSISQSVLTFAAIALAAVLIVVMLPEELVGGVIVIAMRLLGLTALTFSVNSAAAGKCKNNDKCHRGRFQAQGGGLEASQPWAQVAPLTLGQATALLTTLQASLSPKDQALRAGPFAQAFRFIEGAAVSGGVCATVMKSFYPDPPLPNGIRVDIEVRAGQAFVP
ncbi:transglutaminase domain-containing protein [Undibacterium sp. CY18W]|uniref:Transglutaminase domain-containing protein n=1 Tax=Undibacterium hunanense TaxID=2762292 RepID=A0ABR6ZW95_9BURK|nr:transglutaminase-like domain-containing protein [Undibacterium hunanense]MBC3920141.1 transglutaminase domain-containing protein [Undibacterium hunanense]